MAKVLLVLVVVVCGVYSAFGQERECKFESYKQCFSELKKEKEAGKDKPFTAEGLDKKCSLFWEAEECLQGYKAACEKAGKWEEITTIGFGLKNKMKELCNNTETKTEFLKHIACFNENKQAMVDCKNKFKPAQEETDPAKKACCKGKAASVCVKDVAIVKCPAAKDVLEKLLAKSQEKSKEYCESKGFLAQCAAGDAPTTPRPAK